MTTQLQHGERAITSLDQAAWLVSQGYELLEIEYNGQGRATFIFRNDSIELDADARAFELGQAEGNVSLAFGARVKLMRRIRERLP